jgi:hypothetical protein
VRNQAVTVRRSRGALLEEKAKHKRQSRMLQQRLEQTSGDKRMNESQEARVRAVLKEVDVHLGLAAASIQWRDHFGFREPDPQSLDAKKSVFMLKSRFEAKPTWDVEVSTILSDNFQLVLDMFKWVYTTELLRAVCESERADEDETRTKASVTSSTLPSLASQASMSQLREVQVTEPRKFAGAFVTRYIVAPRS